MSNTYTWKINELERNVADGGVTVVHYGVDVTDGTDTLGAYGTVSLTPDANADDFVPFDSLTEAQVIGWVQDALGEEQVANIQSQLDAKLHEMQNPVTATGKPWVEAPAE